MIPFTLLTAFETPLPSNLSWSPSRSSSASIFPFDAPEGTLPLPKEDSVITSASTVGLPLESRICLPLTATIFGPSFPISRHVARNSPLNLILQEPDGGVVQWL